MKHSTIVSPLVFLVALALNIASAQTSTPPWPMYHGGPQHTGQSSVDGPKTADVRWTITDAAIANANVFNSSSVDQNGTIYVCAANKLLALRSIDGSGTICSTKKAGRDAMKEEKEMQTRVVSAFCSGLRAWIKGLHNPA
jgi:poly(3-hydroxybutyrate) depolymerase